MKIVLAGIWLLVLASVGCNAIPINIPNPEANSDGATMPDQGDRGPTLDAAAIALPDSYKMQSDQPDTFGGIPPGSPDAATTADGFWNQKADGGADMFRLPDACLGDAIGDVFCPTPPDGGGGTSDATAIDATTDATTDDGTAGLDVSQGG